MNLSNKKALVYDLGLFTENALRLLRDCAEVKYFVSWAEAAFAEPYRLKIGDGLDGLERVPTLWDHVDQADFILVPDTTCGDLVEFLKKHDYPVAGAGAAEKIETDRWFGRAMQKRNGLPVQETVKIKGISALREFCKTHKRFYVKIDNAFRGVCESFKHDDWRASEGRIDYVSYKVGPYKEDVLFTCEELLPGIEPGIDAATWDGDMMFPCMAGYERKGSGYIGRVYQDEGQFPDPLMFIHEGFAPDFEKFKTRFFYSAEVKIDKDRVPYLLDPTIRLAAPGVAACQTEIIENYSEVVYGMATGERVDPIMKHKYCAAISIESGEASNGFVNIKFPRDLRQWVKLRMAIRHAGKYYSVPPFNSLGTVISLGDSIKEVVGLAKERLEEVKALGLSTDLSGLDSLQEDIETGRSYGITF